MPAAVDSSIVAKLHNITGRPGAYDAALDVAEGLSASLVQQKTIPPRCQDLKLFTGRGILVEPCRVPAEDSNDQHNDIALSSLVLHDDRVRRAQTSCATGRPDRSGSHGSHFPFAVRKQFYMSITRLSHGLK